MPRILVLYYSRTGNTKKMAEAVEEGARTIDGVEVERNFDTTPQALNNYDAILVGVPTYHHDRTIEITKTFEEAAAENINLRGKIGASFGSYGWSGEAPRLILEIMRNKFEMSVYEPPLLSKYAPDQLCLEECRELARKTAEKLIQST